MNKKKGKKIVYPEPLKVYDYLNNGQGVCNKCGALMDETTKNGFDVYICPACGWECDVMDYEYEDGDEMELVQDDEGNDYLVPKIDMPPPGCRACGGPYPYCKADCRMYDD